MYRANYPYPHCLARFHEITSKGCINTRKTSLSAIRIDHLFRQAKSDSRNHLSATLRQVTFSSPDSSGRQYPLSRDHRHPARTIPAIRQQTPLSLSSANDPRKPVPPRTYRRKSKERKKTGDPLVAMASAGPCPHT